MDTDTVTTAAARRNWVVLLYFYAAALVGLGFVVVGMTTALFGLKAAALPELGLPAHAYEGGLPRDEDGDVRASEAERAAARERAIDDRRSHGVDDVLSGAILVVVGAPTMVWHLRRGRRLTPVPA